MPVSAKATTANKSTARKKSTAKKSTAKKSTARKKSTAKKSSARLGHGGGRGYGPPGGNRTAVPMPEYVCPHGDYIWHRVKVGQPIPNCPKHKVPLVRG